MPPIAQPFTIPHSAEAVADLHRRLDNTRFPLGVANEPCSKNGFNRSCTIGAMNLVGNNKLQK